MSLSSRRSHLCLIALVCSTLVLASCHGSSKDASTSSTVPSTDAKGRPVSLSLTLGTMKVDSVGAAKPFDPATAKSIRKLINKYIATGISNPLFKGRPANGLVRYFSPSLYKRIAPKSHDRRALTDENEPVITSVTKTEKAKLNLVALQENGRLAMIGAQFALAVKGETAQGPLTVSRLGNFVFESNIRNQWYITGYDLVVRRSTGSTTTTTKVTTTTAAK